MMRTILLLICVVFLAGCVGWTGTSKLQSSNADTYTGYVSTEPGMVAFGLPGMVLPASYTIADCPGQKKALTNAPALWVGTDPLDKVCTQYAGVDLRDYDPSVIDCFPIAEHSEDPQMVTGKVYEHPWLNPNPAPHCQNLIAAIKAGRKDQ